MRTFICKTEEEFTKTMFNLFYSIPIAERNDELDRLKGDIQAYLGQNGMQFPEAAAVFNDMFRDGLKGGITRAAATGN